MTTNAEYFAANPDATILDLIAWQQEQNAARRATTPVDLDHVVTAAPRPVCTGYVGDYWCCDRHHIAMYGRPLAPQAPARPSYDDDLVDFDVVL